MQVVLLVDAVNEQDTWLGPIPCTTQDLIPQCCGTYCLVDLTLEHQVEVCVVLHCLHEDISHTHRDVELCQFGAVVLRRDELLDVWVVYTQDTHLCASTVASGRNGLTHGVEDTHE